jgi:hypothetical protein
LGVTECNKNGEKEPKLVFFLFVKTSPLEVSAESSEVRVPESVPFSLNFQSSDLSERFGKLDFFFFVKPSPKVSI